MKVRDKGAFYEVLCTEGDVETFARWWPGLGAAHDVAFEFDKRNGDLVAVYGDEGLDERGVVALSYDAQEHGKFVLGISN